MGFTANTRFWALHESEIPSFEVGRLLESAGSLEKPPVAQGMKLDRRYRSIRQAEYWSATYCRPPDESRRNGLKLYLRRPRAGGQNLSVFDCGLAHNAPELPDSRLPRKEAVS